MQNFSIFEITDVEEIRQWSTELEHSQKKEALKSLENENVHSEAMHYFQIGDRHFIAGIMCGDDIKSTDMEMQVNKKHREILQRAKKGKIKSELLYLLERE